MWAVTAGLIGYCAKKLKEVADDRLVPLMGVLGAFIFAAQMINFTLPGMPGTSGHLGGGVLLAILLGPARAILCITAILIVQCLMFQDGGLLGRAAPTLNDHITVSRFQLDCAARPPQ